MFNHRIFIIFIIFIILIIIILFLKHRNTELYQNYKHPFFNDIKNFPRRKNVLILSAGPSLNEIDDIKKHFTKEFLKNTYIICIKSAINKARDIKLPVDFIVTNGDGNYNKINLKHLKKKNRDQTKLLCIEYYKGCIESYKKLCKECDYIFKIQNRNEFNIMECIDKNRKDCIGFDVKNNDFYARWGHIMMELAIPLSIMLKPENIITLGWDYKYTKNSNNTYWNDSVEKFTNYSTNKNVILNFTGNLSNYLKKNYNINIYKLSKYSGVKIPYLNLSKVKW